MDIAELIRTYADEKLTGTDFQLIEIENRPGSRKYVAFIDGESAVSIDLCIEVSRHISRRFDEVLPESSEGFIFEVSSPGADRPLKFAWQLKKHIGRYLQWSDEEGKSHEAEITGITADTAIEMLAGEPAKKGKKLAERMPLSIPFSTMIKPRIAIKFK